MATLIREPSNQYDPNAIRVDNLAGTQAALAYPNPKPNPNPNPKPKPN